MWKVKYLFLVPDTCGKNPGICGDAQCENTREVIGYECVCQKGYEYNVTSKGCNGKNILFGTLDNKAYLI